MKKVGKRILCLLCSGTILMSGSVFAAEAAYTVDEIEDRFETFRVINYNGETFSEENTLTRAKMAKVLMRLHGYDVPHMNAPREYCFADVPLEHDDYYWILIAKNNMLVNGDGNGNFRPNEKVAQIDAVKMLISFAGYDWIAEKCGGYPQGYAAAAEILGLTKETGDLTMEPMTRDQLLYILNRFIDIPMAGTNEEGVVCLAADDEKSGSDGTMKSWLRLKSSQIEDPFANK